MRQKQKNNFSLRLRVVGGNLTAKQLFDDNANAGERFKFTLDRVGKDKFKEKILEAYNG